MAALVAILEQADADSSIEHKYKSSDANTNANRILGMEANESLFPVGECFENLFFEEKYFFVKSGKSCHELCEHFNLTSSPEPDRELKCIRNRTETEYSVVYSESCEDAKFLTFDECQQRYPGKPYNRVQCLCGGEDEDDAQQVMVCDTDYYRELTRTRPPLECASLNITDRNSCIDVATSFGKDRYCNHTSTPCTLKYQTIGNRAMCTKRWGWEGTPEVICGDACAWTEEAWSGGHRIAGRLGITGLALGIAIAIVLF